MKCRLTLRRRGRPVRYAADVDVTLATAWEEMGLLVACVWEHAPRAAVDEHTGPSIKVSHSDRSAPRPRSISRHGRGVRIAAMRTTYGV